MKKLNFYGHSDDIFMAADDECYSGKVLITSNEGSLVVIAEYIDNGCWAIGIAPADEDETMPVWPISYKQSSCGYSTVLTIEAPDDAEVRSFDV